MANLSNISDELLKPSITPEKALQLLDAYPSADSFSQEDQDPIRIFLAYFMFIVEKRSDGSIIGIWEEILCKTVKYSKHVISFGDIYAEDLGVNLWLYTILKSRSLCPNPYTRLELFRLGRLFNLRIVACETFIDTICLIKPHRFYPSGNSDDLLFEAIDLHYILIKCKNTSFIRELIILGTNRQLDDRNEIIENKFILNCIHLVGIFAATACSNIDDPLQRSIDLDHCCVAFVDGICLIVPSVSDTISKQPYLYYVIEFLRNVSIGATTLRHATMCYDVMNDIRMRYVDPSDKILRRGNPTHLPKLILNRQIHDSRFIQQNYILDSRIKMYFTNSQPFSIIERLLSLEDTFLNGYRSVRDNQMDSSLSGFYNSRDEENNFTSDDNL